MLKTHSPLVDDAWHELRQLYLQHEAAIRSAPDGLPPNHPYVMAWHRYQSLAAEYRHVIDGILVR